MLRSIMRWFAFDLHGALVRVGWRQALKGERFMLQVWHTVRKDRAQALG